MTNPFQKVVGFIKHAAVLVAHGFITVFGADKSAAFGHAALGVLDSALGKIVMKSVEALQSVSPTLSNDAKRAQAFSAVVETAKAQGLGASESIINMLIELAVQVLKGSFATAPSLDPISVKFAEGADPAVGAAEDGSGAEAAQFDQSSGIINADQLSVGSAGTSGTPQE